MWLWLTTGMVTRGGWPSTQAPRQVRDRRGPAQPDGLWPLGRAGAGVDLYREAKNAETISRYGYGTPDDWMERNVYGKLHLAGDGRIADHLRGVVRLCRAGV